LATVSENLGKFRVALGFSSNHLTKRGSSQTRAVQLGRRHISFHLHTAGQVHLGSREHPTSLKGAEETGNKSDQAQFLYVLGHIKLEQGDLTATEEIIKQA